MNPKARIMSFLFVYNHCFDFLIAIDATYFRTLNTGLTSAEILTENTIKSHTSEKKLVVSAHSFRVFMKNMQTDMEVGTSLLELS